ncbi:MAG: restriction endonuclease subunit S, partial [Streptococcus mitis]|nr:restriction endonuclease subunit S [Streptococcus mitis]
MNENKLTPSIRFKNNDGESYPEWDFVKVKEIASINTGNKDTKDAVENGQYDFYVRSPIVHKIDSFSYDGEAILTV